MLRPLVSLLVFVMAAAPRACDAQEQPEASAPPPSTAPVQETQVTGTPPDLGGRWLSLAWIEKPDGTSTSLPALWEIIAQDGKPVLTHRFVSLPSAQNDALSQANAAGQPWKPSPADLAQIRAAWNDLPAADAHVARVTNEIAARDGFDDDLKSEARTKDAMWVMRQRQDFDASGAPVIRQVAVYSILTPSDGDFTGNFDSVTLAAAPFPLPVPFKGTFRLYRLDAPDRTAAEPPARGFLSRLFDVFSGCGRSRQGD
jgi:hypothetical protein